MNSDFACVIKTNTKEGEKNQHYLSKLRTKTKLIEIKLAELCRKTKFL